MMPARPSRICSRSSKAMKSSRRSFLEAGLGLPVLLGATPSLAVTSQAAETTASRDSSFDPWVEIHRENLRHNVQEISRRIASRPILAVIKNNGYGMGVANVARLLEPQPEIFGFAVVKLHEAICLRDAGIRKRILLLGPFDEKNLEDAVARSVIPMVYTPLGPALDNIAAKTQKPVPLHICLDTGIGRVGVPYYQAAPLVRDLAARKSLDLHGLAGGEVADERCGLVVRDANAADAGIDADVQRDGLLRFRRNVVERWAERRVDHRYDAASNGIFKILFVERAEKQDALADAGIAQADGFVKFDDSEAEDFGLWLEEPSDIGDAHAVSVVFDHRQDGPRSDAA